MMQTTSVTPMLLLLQIQQPMKDHPTMCCILLVFFFLYRTMYVHNYDYDYDICAIALVQISAESAQTTL